MLVSTNPEFLNPALVAAGKNGIEAIRGGNNMAAIDLAGAVGGDTFLGFISAVAFATTSPSPASRARSTGLISGTCQSVEPRAR